MLMMMMNIMMRPVQCFSVLFNVKRDEKIDRAGESSAVEEER